MSRRPILAALLAALLCGEALFLSGAEDIPLPPALHEHEGSASFEGDAGRILQAEADGESSAAAVRAFYEAAMPALGWSQAPGDALLFQRGRERLAIEVTEAPPRVSVRLQLVTRAAPQVLD